MDEKKLQKHRWIILRISIVSLNFRAVFLLIKILMKSNCIDRKLRNAHHINECEGYWFNFMMNMEIILFIFDAFPTFIQIHKKFQKNMHKKGRNYRPLNDNRCIPGIGHQHFHTHKSTLLKNSFVHNRNVCNTHTLYVYVLQIYLSLTLHPHLCVCNCLVWIFCKKKKFNM